MTLDPDAVKRRMAALSDEELMDVVTRQRDTYRPEAIEIAEAEVASRRLDPARRSAAQGQLLTEANELEDRLDRRGPTKVGHVVIVGIVCILIAGALGVFGMNLADNGGFLALVGWAIALPSFAFAGLALMHLFRVVSGTWHALRLMERDPEAFAQLKKRYDDAVRRVDE